MIIHIAFVLSMGYKVKKKTVFYIRNLYSKELELTNDSKEKKNRFLQVNKNPMTFMRLTTHLG